MPGTTVVTADKVVGKIHMKPTFTEVIIYLEFPPKETRRGDIIQ